MGAANTALLGTLLGTLIAAQLWTLLYLSRKIDTGTENTNTRIDAQSENLNTRTYDVDTKLSADIATSNADSN